MTERGPDDRILAELLVQSSVDGLAAIDRDYRYTLWNRAMEEFAGKRAEEVIGQRVFDVFPFLRDLGLDLAMERALAGEEVMAEAVPNVMPDGMELSLEGRIRFVNRVLPHVTREQVIGHSWVEWMMPERRAIAEAAFERLVRTRETQSFETLGIGVDERPVWYHTRLSPVIYDGKLEGVTLVSDDISARKDAAIALHASEERYRALFEQAPVPIGIHRAGHPIYANPAHHRLFGIESLEGVDSLLDLVAPESRQAVIGRMQRRAAGDRSELEYEFIGTRFPCLTSVVPVVLSDLARVSRAG